MEFVRFDSGDVLRKERDGQGPRMLRLVVGTRALGIAKELDMKVEGLLRRRRDGGRENGLRV